MTTQAGVRRYTEEEKITGPHAAKWHARSLAHPQFLNLTLTLPKVPFLGLEKSRIDAMDLGEMRTCISVGDVRWIVGSG